MYGIWSHFSWRGLGFGLWKSRLGFEDNIRRQFWPCAWLSNWNVSVKCLPSLQQNFAHTHARACCSPSYFIVTLSLIRRTACARAHFSGFSSMTNAHSQMTACCRNLTLGALSIRSALSVLVGDLFKKFGLFLNTPRSSYRSRISRVNWIHLGAGLLCTCYWNLMAPKLQGFFFWQVEKNKYCTPWS
jgi:hypothetical protein